jgi:hypothetical protein
VYNSNNDNQTDIQTCADIKFIAHAREDMPTLLGYIGQLRAENAELQVADCWKKRADVLECAIIDVMRRWAKDEKFNVCKYCKKADGNYNEQCGDCNSTADTVLKNFIFDETKYIEGSDKAQ